jgi:hypothetical protein
MLTDYIDPAERIVATPDQNVVYGISILSLDREPVVLQVHGGEEAQGMGFGAVRLTRRRYDAGSGELGEQLSSACPRMTRW